MNPLWILIVEDEFITALDLKNNLEEMGYRVSAIVATGESAIDTAGELKPDIILMDIALCGKMNGITAAEKIKELYHIPVIFLTAHSDDATFERAKETDPFGYIVKPFDQVNLRTSIEIAFNKNASEEKIREQDRAIQALMNATGDAAMLLTVDGIILMANEKMSALLDRPNDNLKNTSIYEYVNEKGIFPRLAEEIQKSRSGTRIYFEEENRDRWFGTIIQPVMDSGVIVRQIALICHDITMHKMTENELKELNEKLAREKEQLEVFRMAMNQMNDCVIITDGQGYILYINETFTKRYGYPNESVRGLHIQDFAHQTNKFDLSIKFFRNYAEGDWTGQFIGQNKFGVKLFQTIKGAPIQYENKRIKSFVFVLRERYEIANG